MFGGLFESVSRTEVDFKLTVRGPLSTIPIGRETECHLIVCGARNPSHHNGILRASLRFLSLFPRLSDVHSQLVFELRPQELFTTLIQPVTIPPREGYDVLGVEIVDVTGVFGIKNNFLVRSMIPTSVQPVDQQIGETAAGQKR